MGKVAGFENAIGSPLKVVFENLSPPVSNQKLFAKEFFFIGARSGISTFLEIPFNNNMDVESILKIYIPRHNTNDRKIWPFTKTSELTTKSAYIIMIKERDRISRPLLQWNTLRCLPLAPSKS